MLVLCLGLGGNHNCGSLGCDCGWCVRVKLVLVLVHVDVCASWERREGEVACSRRFG